MFETAELGRKISKKAFAEQEPELRTQLLEVQRALKTTNTAVVIIVSGVEGAGKGEVVNRLTKWLDTRGLQTYSFWDTTDEEQQRPRFWRFWRTLPARGDIGIMFGSWYTQPIVKRVFGRMDDTEFDHEMARIADLEHLLTQDGVLFVKLWFHLSKRLQAERVAADTKKNIQYWKQSPLEKKFAKYYDKFASISERAIRLTDNGDSPWHLVEASDRRYRDLITGRILLDAIEQRLASKTVAFAHPNGHAPFPTDEPAAQLTVLDQVPLDEQLDEASYRRQLARYQKKLYKLAWNAYEQQRSTVIVFEGWDAAGKGGAIRRLTAALDARLYRVLSVAAPSDEERAHHYLWRFWRQLPRGGRFSIYDRSWYGRVLVERVEGFATADEWMRAYQEINDFEEQLAEFGITVVKFWLHIDPDEQLRRFKDREATPWKLHKITEEDWRNREKWSDYKHAVNEMVARTSTAQAPWTLVPANDKRYARICVLKNLTESLEHALEEPPKESSGKKKSKRK